MRISRWYICIYRTFTAVCQGQHHLDWNILVKYRRLTEHSDFNFCRVFAVAVGDGQLINGCIHPTRPAAGQLGSTTAVRNRNVLTAVDILQREQRSFRPNFYRTENSFLFSSDDSNECGCKPLRWLLWPAFILTTCNTVGHFGWQSKKNFRQSNLTLN